MSDSGMFYENEDSKVFRSESYNFDFDKITGKFSRWGKELADDPNFSPIGPEILDIEISTGSGCLCCPMCYKGNGVKGKPTVNMTLDQFKTIMNKFPGPAENSKFLTQIAFGIMMIDTNPDFFPMMEYARSIGIIPNYTTNGHGVTEEVAKRTSELCGAIAVSQYPWNKDIAYDAIHKYTSAGMKQCNCHKLLAKESLDDCFSLIDDVKSDPRLKNLNAIVFLMFKPKGPGKDKFHSVDLEDYKKLVAYCTENKVNFGFDSCSAPMYLKAAATPETEQFAESCESGLFSSYINCKGEFFPCSFSENEGEWSEGIDALNCQSFLKDVWYHPRVISWRENLISSCKNCNCPYANRGCRACPLFPEITKCKEESNEDS
jgi:hypothetical protein